MGRRRAENACASLLLSCRALRPPLRTYQRVHARNQSNLPSDAPLPEGYSRPTHPGDKDAIFHVPGVAEHGPPAKKRENLPAAPHVAVLGGGLTGLTTAFYLAKKLPRESKIVVYEADKRWGGWINSERTQVSVNGYDREVLFERGPRLISLAKVQGRLDKVVFVDIMESLGLLPGSPPPNLGRFIWNDDKVRELGISSVQACVGLLTSPSFWRMLREVAPVMLRNYVYTPLLNLGLRAFNQEQKRRERSPWLYTDISAVEFLKRVTGSEAHALNNSFVSAMAHGIWGGSTHKLSAVSAMGSLIDGYHAYENADVLQHQMKFAPEGSFLYQKREYRFFRRFFGDLDDEGRSDSFVDLWSRTPDSMAHVGSHGLQSLPQGLVDMLSSAPNVELRLEKGVKKVSYDEQNKTIEVEDSQGETQRYDKVISTLPAHNLAVATRDQLPLAEYEAVSIMTVNLWYPRNHPIFNAVGYLIPLSIPREENPERALGVFFDSRAGIGERPDALAGDKSKVENGTKLFVLLGGHLYDRDGVEPPSPEEAVRQAKRLVERHLGISQDETCYATAKLAKECLPQHNVGHHRRNTRLHDALVQRYSNRLAVAGGSYTKPGVAGAMRAGYDIADAVANDDFLTTGLEHVLEPEIYAGTPLTIVDGSKDNELFKKIARVKDKAIKGK